MLVLDIGPTRGEMEKILLKEGVAREEGIVVVENVLGEDIEGDPSRMFFLL
jgi:hypothetical protein